MARIITTALHRRSRIISKNRKTGGRRIALSKCMCGHPTARSVVLRLQSPRRPFRKNKLPRWLNLRLPLAAVASWPAGRPFPRMRQAAVRDRHVANHHAALPWGFTTQRRTSAPPDRHRLPPRLPVRAQASAREREKDKGREAGLDKFSRTAPQCGRNAPVYRWLWRDAAGMPSRDLSTAYPAAAKARRKKGGPKAALLLRPSHDDDRRAGGDPAIEIDDVLLDQPDAAA